MKEEVKEPIKEWGGETPKERKGRGGKRRIQGTACRETEGKEDPRGCHRSLRRGRERMGKERGRGEGEGQVKGKGKQGSGKGKEGRRQRVKGERRKPPTYLSICHT